MGRAKEPANLFYLIDLKCTNSWRRLFQQLGSNERRPI